MLNLFDPSGRKLTSIEEKRRPIAPRAQKSARLMGARKVIPFSDFHRYQREDSVWINDLVPDLADYYTDALKKWPEILPAFVRVDCETDAITPLNPQRRPLAVKKPEDFGDSWSDPLTVEDKVKIRDYFNRPRDPARPFWVHRGLGRRFERDGRPQPRQARCRDPFRGSAKFTDERH